MVDNFSAIKTVVDIVITLLIYKGVIEPIAAYHGKRLTVKYVPKLLDRLDKYVPELLYQGKEKFKEAVLSQIEILSEENKQTLTKAQKDWLVKQYESYYSPIVNAAKLDAAKLEE